MTVCIAAIYDNTSIIGASDRMITAGNIQFEPPRPKIISVSNSIVIMTAGDANIQTQLAVSAAQAVSEQIASDPAEWVPVLNVANFYRDMYVKIRADEAEKAVLAPYGLSQETFISRQKEMTDDFIKSVSEQLQAYQLESAHTIIAGLDQTGPHIFTIRNDEVTWDDSIGFSAVEPVTRSSKTTLSGAGLASCFCASAG